MMFSPKLCSICDKFVTNLTRFLITFSSSCSMQMIMEGGSRRMMDGLSRKWIESDVFHIVRAFPFKPQNFALIWCEV